MFLSCVLCIITTHGTNGLIMIYIAGDIIVKYHTVFNKYMYLNQIVFQFMKTMQLCFYIYKPNYV